MEIVNIAELRAVFAMVLIFLLALRGAIIDKRAGGAGEEVGALGRWCLGTDFAYPSWDQIGVTSLQKVNRIPWYVARTGGCLGDVHEGWAGRMRQTAWRVE